MIDRLVIYAAAKPNIPTSATTTRISAPFRLPHDRAAVPLHRSYLEVPTNSRGARQVILTHLDPAPPHAFRLAILARRPARTGDAGSSSGWHRGRGSLSGPTQNMPRPYFPTSGTPHLHSELRPSGRCLITSSARLRTAAPPQASHQACLQVLRMHAIPGPIVSPRAPPPPPLGAGPPPPALSRSASVRHAKGVTPILINTARWATEVDPYPWRTHVVSQQSPRPGRHTITPVEIPQGPC